MPVGIQRINARHQQPNSRITFIKPLPGPDAPLAQDYLERIAAICHPIMKAHHLSVTTLEEYEPNREFIGRNFNNGEIIQLVLKSHGGGWLPFRHVQMVMMHELAHNVQMNHSKFFWIERNKFSAELKLLWQRGYSGDGLYGLGHTTEEGRRVEANTVAMQDEQSPLALCGGTYRSRRRSRKRKRGQPDLTWKDREEKRIEKKFGKMGVALGGDEEIRVVLEQGKKPKGKPRIAGSNRGRELRAAAALARFGPKEEEEEVVKEEGDLDDSGTDYEDDDLKPDVKDMNGQRVLDARGQGMVKVCGDEDPDDTEVKRELEEFHAIDMECAHIKREPHFDTTPDYMHESSPAVEDLPLKKEYVLMKDIPQYQEPELEAQHSAPSTPSRLNDELTTTPATMPTTASPAMSSRLPGTEPQASKLRPGAPVICEACSMENDRLSPTCVTCSNVLDLRKVTSFWRCRSDLCKGSDYINAGDCGMCGVCGTKQAT